MPTAALPAASLVTEDAPAKPVKHEEIGRSVQLCDPQLGKILKEAGHDANEIANLFSRKAPDLELANLISSDLDADRLDYLARGAKHTGLPYGVTDIPYLLERIGIDDQRSLCFDEKALRSVEHMLIARFFDYQTLVRQRTVAGLELVLSKVLAWMMRGDTLPKTKEDVERLIVDGEWTGYDDVDLMNRIRKAETRFCTPIEKDMLHCVRG